MTTIKIAELEGIVKKYLNKIKEYDAQYRGSNSSVNNFSHSGWVSIGLLKTPYK